MTLSTNKFLDWLKLWDEGKKFSKNIAQFQLGLV